MLHLIVISQSLVLHNKCFCVVHFVCAQVQCVDSVLLLGKVWPCYSEAFHWRVQLSPCVPVPNGLLFLNHFLVTLPKRNLHPPEITWHLRMFWAGRETHGSSESNPAPVQDTPAIPPCTWELFLNPSWTLSGCDCFHHLFSPILHLTLFWV